MRVGITRDRPRAWRRGISDAWLLFDSDTLEMKKVKVKVWPLGQVLTVRAGKLQLQEGGRPMGVKDLNHVTPGDLFTYKRNKKKVNKLQSFMNSMCA